jgi:3-dehydroquinate dehydratase type I
MMPRYCLPIKKTSKAEVLETIRSHDDEYDYFEVWLDYVDSVDENFIKQLVDLAGGRLVLLFRRQGLEAIKMPLEQRFSILELLNGTGVLVDLDVTIQTEELNYARDHNLKLKTIASYHNYQVTPNTVQLDKIIATMDGYQPEVYKLAALCGSAEDALRLLERLLALKSAGRRVIVLGMGEFGQVTRVFGGLWGNEMTFAPLAQAEASAPGQLTKSQLETIFKELSS